MRCFVRLLSLKTFFITVNRLLTESVRPMLTNMHMLPMRSFREYEKCRLLKKRDFALILLAEEAAMPKKIENK